MRPLNLVFVLLLMAFSGIAQAQSNEKQLGEANRSAMDAYNNLEIEVAKETLQRAVANAERHGLGGPGLARTYANLGVVEIGGFSDASAALDAFVKALREDPNVEPDPLVSTPEVLQVFAQAKRRAAQGGSRSRSRTPPPPAMVEGNLEHVPAAEQLVNAPVPVYVANTDPEVASMKIFYRSIGMRQPKSSQMTQTSDGFTYMIPCEDVFAPKVEYFVLAFDSEGNRIGNAGTPENPVTVPIVSRRSQPAPSLPGQVPPSQCGGGEEEPFAAEDDEPGYSECTPGMPGCGREGALGDSCHDDMDCGEGLTCLDNFCAFGSRDKSKKKDNGDAPRFYFDFGVGLGAAMVSNGMRADSAPPGSLLASIDNKLTMSGNPSPELAKDLVSREGWDCAVAEGLDPTTNRRFYTYSDCKVTVGSSGLVAMPVLNATIGYYVTPRIALAALARYQIGHGQGTIGLSGGLRADILLTQPTAKGLFAGLLAGVLVGPIQARPPKKAGAETEGPYATSGPFGLQAGLRLGYRFTRNFGLQLTPAANLMLGDFMFALDATAGVTLSF